MVSQRIFWKSAAVKGYEWVTLLDQKGYNRQMPYLVVPAYNKEGIDLFPGNKWWTSTTHISSCGGRHGTKHWRIRWDCSCTNEFTAPFREHDTEELFLWAFLYPYYSPFQWSHVTLLDRTLHIAVADKFNIGIRECFSSGSIHHDLKLDALLSLFDSMLNRWCAAYMNCLIVKGRGRNLKARKKFQNICLRDIPGYIAQFYTWPVTKWLAKVHVSIAGRWEVVATYFWLIILERHGICESANSCCLLRSSRHWRAFKWCWSAT